MKNIIVMSIVLSLSAPCFSVDLAKQNRIQVNPKKKVDRQITIARKVYLR